LSRKRFEYLIADTQDDLLKLGNNVEQSLQHAAQCLCTHNPAVARWIIEHDKDIDEAHRNLEARVIQLLATQQPIVAYDLRMLITVSAIATELERIGDYAVSIARRVLRAENYTAAINLPSEIDQMTSTVQHMVHISLESFIQQDEALARSLGTLDDNVDVLEDEMNAYFRGLLRSKPLLLDPILDWLDMVHALERAADRATNIGERVIYCITSGTEELNP
jgi:phosphate transport system protein